MLRINKVFNFFLFALRFGNIKMAYFLSKYCLPLDRMQEVTVKKGKLMVRKTGQSFSIEQMWRCKESLNLFLTLAQNPGIQFDTSKEGEITFVCGNTRIKGDTFDNFYVIEELFADGAYSSTLNTDKMVVCDVGMNVGIASLYFAGLKNVSKVYSFEPFPETFNRALGNISLNPTIKDKIIPHNAGVGGNDAVLEIPIIKGESAMMSTSDFVIKQMNTDKSHTVTVGITDIKKIIHSVFQQHPNEAILLKLDCEGAEYEIIDQLNQTGMLKKINVIIIEWHMKGYQSLKETLLANNFCTTVFPRPNSIMQDIGLIYAVNTQKM